MADDPLPLSELENLRQDKRIPPLNSPVSGRAGKMLQAITKMLGGSIPSFGKPSARTMRGANEDFADNRGAADELTDIYADDHPIWDRPAGAIPDKRLGPVEKLLHGSEDYALVNPRFQDYQWEGRDKPNARDLEHFHEWPTDSKIHGFVKRFGTESLGPEYQRDPYADTEGARKEYNRGKGLPEEYDPRFEGVPGPREGLEGASPEDLDAIRQWDAWQKGTGPEPKPRSAEQEIIDRLTEEDEKSKRDKEFESTPFFQRPR